MHIWDTVKCPEYRGVLISGVSFKRGSTVDPRFYWIFFFCHSPCLAVPQSLLEQSDFLVVGALGKQGVGKSTIMSLLAGTRTGSGK